MESGRGLTVQAAASTQQLGGTASSAPGFSLASLLVCEGCDQPLQPSHTTGGQRVYVFLCGCHRGEVSGDVVERLARDRVEVESYALVADVPPDRLGQVFRGLFAQVRTGSSTDDLAFVWRL
ncbi:hypothetical protein [Dactylosporangium darangshiense]|uniref:hypothetical protein n=1 Tax=Dactylosporangium darangshiense TaxID=579108 RepID=UPI0031E6B8C9